MNKPELEPEAKKVIGKSVARIDGMEKVIGKACFPGDLQMDGQVYMKVLFARRPHARILGIDTSDALALPGVLAVLTAQDVPVNLYGIEIADQAVLCAEVVRFVGDRIALVVAESETLAAQATSLIRVELEDLPVVDNPKAAQVPGAPIIHPDKPDNVLACYQIVAGDLSAGFAQADLILEETYCMGSQEHAYLQPDAGLAWIDEHKRLVIQSAGQMAHEDQRQIACCLGLPEEQVRVIYTHIGGAFGGREDLNLQICLAVAAWRVRRPVKAIWSREETTLGHPKRHPMEIRHRWGVTAQGKLVAQDIEIIADAGAYASTSVSVLGTTTMLCTGPYVAQNVQVSAKAIYTNNPVSGAFRGFGAPQAIFAAELHIAHLATALGIDPVELRMRNLVEESSRLATIGQIPPAVSARQTLAAAARSAGWEQTKGRWSYPRRQPGMRKQQGVGIATGWKPVGYSLGWQEQATITIDLHGNTEIETATIHAAVADLGQGAHTVLCQMAAQALGLPIKYIELSPVDTSLPGSAGPSTASRITLMAGNALIGAAKVALQAWKNEERPAVGTYTYHAPTTQDFAALTDQDSTALSISYLAQAVVIEVDEQTGHITIQRIISAHDVGKAINPQAVAGQVQGGAVQGIGWATLEDFVVQHGQVLTTELSTYLIPTVLDIPAEFDVIILENLSPRGPWGATGVGEMPLLAVAPAIADALHDATGVWCNQIPLTPERVWHKLSKK